MVNAGILKSWVTIVLPLDKVFFSFFSQVVYKFLKALTSAVSAEPIKIEGVLKKDYHNLKGLIGNPLKMHETHQMCWKHVKKCQNFV